MGTVIKITTSVSFYSLQREAFGLDQLSAGQSGATPALEASVSSFGKQEKKSLCHVPVHGLFFWARREGQETEEVKREKWSLVIGRKAERKTAAWAVGGM